MKKITLLSVLVALLLLPSCKAKEDPTPSPQPTPSPSVDFNHRFTFWQMDADYATEAQSSWVNDNKIYSNQGSGTSVAYAYTEGENVQRIKSGNLLGAANLTEGCSINFIWPSVTVAAGSVVDFMGCFYSSSSATPKYWIFEYYDDGKWKSVEADLKTAKEDSAIKYSFYLFTSTEQPETFAQSFTLEKALNSKPLTVRIRAVGKINAGGGTLTASSSAYVAMVNFPYRSASLDIYQGVTTKDSKKVLELGNSFSYYYGSAFVLKEIARTQGHEIRLRAFNKASQTFADHMTLEKSCAEVNDGNFDYAILQDQSGQHAKYADDSVTNASVLSDTKKLFANVKASSPSANIILENTWSFAGSGGTYAGYGSYENFDLLLQSGNRQICKSTGATSSPIGIAFQKARAEGITDLYHTDSKHPNRNGVYLKACVNYLTIYGERFDTNVPDMLVDSKMASELRMIAEDVVIGGWRPTYFKMGTPEGTSFGIEGGQGSVSVSTNVDFTATSDASWATVSTTKEKISWTVSQNNAEQSRTATITITPEGLDKQEITLYQRGTTVTGGINNAAELRDFASKVNAGQDYSKYLDGGGEVALNADIDLAGEAWTPIGLPQTQITVEYNEPVEPTENPFRGTFNGNGHTIKGLSLAVDIQSTQFCGLFATTNGATIKNLTIKDASLVVSGNGICAKHADVAILVGFCYAGKISGVNVSGTVSGSAYSTKSRQVGIGGICGMLANAAVIENCTFAGSMTPSIEEKYTHNNTVNIGGICAVTMYNQGDGNCKIKGCTNTATINVESHRAAGIVAGMFFTDLEGCTNKGDITCNFAPGAISVRGTEITGVRMGGVMGYNSQKSACSSVSNCHNSGTIKTSEAESVAGGTIGLVKCMAISDCDNEGTVIAPASSSKGLLVGALQATNTLTTFNSCKLKGKIGASETSLIDATKDNFLNNGIGATIASGVSCPTWCDEQIRFWE